jgi:glycine dehydrogenase subunit 1
MVTAATIYMALTGPEGLRRIAGNCHANTLALLEKLESLKGIKRIFRGPLFHETAISLPHPAKRVLQALEARKILGGLDLEAYYPELGPAILICATETKTREDMDTYIRHLQEVLETL